MMHARRTVRASSPSGEDREEAWGNHFHHEGIRAPIGPLMEVPLRQRVGWMVFFYHEGMKEMRFPLRGIHILFFLVCWLSDCENCG